jgi:hypothetical protein
VQIVILIFAFCAFAGSWAARRRSPLYSHKTTIKLIGAFLLTAGAIAGGTVAILNGAI